MAQSFSCPSCGAPLDYAGNGTATISCPYCFSSVIVPQELRTQKAEPVARDVTMSLAGQAHKLRELSFLIRNRQRDQAVSVYQQVYHVEMTDAQRLVDQLMSGSPVVITSNVMGQVSNVSISAGGYGPATPPIITNPVNYTYNTPMAVYTATSAANVAQQTRRWVWYIGCFIAFFVFITIVTTLIPIIIGLGAAFMPFFFQ